MDQTFTGTVHGNTIVLDTSPALPEGQPVEVVVREYRSQHLSDLLGSEELSPPTWWTDEDDRILDEIYRARKSSTRPQIAE